MKKILSLTFVILLLVPVVAVFVKPDFKTPEDRVGLKSPQLYTQALFDNRYYKAFDHYYNDSFSLRSPLVYAKRWLDYHVFRTTDSAAIHIGNKGWLYTRQSIEDLRKDACGHENDTRQTALKLYAVEKILESSGRRFFFIVMPNKSTIYPEFTGYVPQHRVCNHSRYDLLLETMARLPLKNFVGLDNLLKEARSGHGLLYDKTGVYWNAMGAMVAAETLQHQLAEDSRQKVVMEYTPAVGVNTGDLRRQLMGYKSTNGDKSVRHLSGTGQSGHPRGIVYGGNFMQVMRPYLQHMFNGLDVIQSNHLPSKGLGEDIRQYEVIFLAVAESDLDSLEIDIAGLLAMIETDGPIAQRYPFGLQSAKAISGISLGLRQSGLEIKSVGGSSVFELQSLPASDENTLRVLKLSFEAPHPDTMSIHYLTDQPHVFDHVIKKGTASIYLPLPFEKPAVIQIHPGLQPGVFRLGSAEIIEFSGHTEEEDRDQTWLMVAGTDLEDDIPRPSSFPESEAEPKIIDNEVHPTASLAVSLVPAPENNELPENDNLSILSGDATDGNAPKPIITGSVPSLPNKTADNSVKNSDSSNPEMTGRTIKTATKDSAAASPVSITVTDFAEGRIFQRSGRGAAIAISGSYIGRPGAIEARVVRDVTHDEVVTWTVIDASPQNGIYVGVIPEVPQGGWYNIQVRSSANHLILARGTRKWGVGILVACLGQSNMKEWFHTGNDLTAHKLVRKYNGKAWARLGRRGNAAIAFGNQITNRLGIPVGLLDFSVNGSGLTKEANWGTGYWEDTSRHSIYSRFVAGVSKVGGAVEFVVWIQGEADAARGTVTEEEYRASLERFISKQVRGDIENGSQRRHLPFLVVAMVKRPGGKDDPHQAVRNAQYKVTEKIADCYLAATTLDLKNQGRQHLADGAYLSMGYRVAQTVLFVVGEETYHRGPFIAGIRQIDSQTIDVNIEHRGGTDILPDSDLTGWEVLENGIPMPLTRVFRHDPQTIRIELERPVTKKALIRYLYGALPDTARPVFDNSAMALPLEEGQFEVN